MRKWFFPLVLALTLWTLSAQAEIVWQSPAANVRVTAVEILQENWLFLPSGSDLENLPLLADGTSLTLNWLEHAATAHGSRWSTKRPISSSWNTPRMCSSPAKTANPAAHGCF